MLKRIDSEDNNRIKLVKKLSAKKHRDSLGRFIIEGINLVEEAINREVELDFILVSEDFVKNENFRRIKEAIYRSVYIVPEQLFEKLTDAQKGLGILAIASRTDYSIEELMNITKGTNVLVLDRVQDPGNIGTMIRTAVAAGYGVIAVMKGSADLYSLKVLRATAGMIFDIPIVHFDTPEELADVLKEMGKRICVTVPVNGTAYYESDISSDIALVIGNEGNGISDELVEIADERITIPMKGKVESLNAAISAGILMYEAIRY